MMLKYINYEMTDGFFKEDLRKCSRNIPHPVATKTTTQRYCTSSRICGTVRVATIQANELTDRLTPSHFQGRSAKV